MFEIQHISIIAGVICSWMYVYLSVKAAAASPAAAAMSQSTAKQASAAGKSAAGADLASVDDFTKLLEAAAKLTDSLSKAGPALTALVGSILFFAIAKADEFTPKDAAPGVSPQKGGPATTAPGNNMAPASSGEVGNKKG